MNPTIIYTYYHLYFHSWWNVPKCGLSLICIFPCMDRIGYDSVHIQENTDQRKPTFRDTSCNVKYNNPRIFLNLITLLSTWRKDAQNSEGYLYLHHSHQKAKMLLEWDCLLPCSNPRRKNAVQMDFLKEENRLTLKLTPVFELAFVCIFWDISV